MNDSIERCARCQAPVTTRQHVDGASVTLQAHPAPQPAPGTYVILATGKVANAGQGTVHVYRRHDCETGEQV